MKIQCSCGAKYSFEVTPEMAQNPIRFVCQKCGLDSSDFVSQLVRDEIAKQFPNVSPPPPPLPPVAPQLKISREEKTAEPAPPTAPVAGHCSRHRDTLTTEKCAVCQKPICPKCMELFGYFCSPFCKNKADSEGIAAPVYAGQKFRVQARFWRKTGLILGLVGAVMAVVAGLWVLYVWYSSVPRTYFSLRFDDNDRAYAGASQRIGKDQIIFLHGGTLARYDLKTKKPVWSLELVTKEQIARIVKLENELRNQEVEAGEHPGVPPVGSQEHEAKVTLQDELTLEVSGQNIWIVKPDDRERDERDFSQVYKLTHYDWNTGKVLQELLLTNRAGFLTSHGDQFVMLDRTNSIQWVTHISMANGQLHTEEFRDPGAVTVASAKGAGRSPGSATPGANNARSSEAEQLAEKVQNLNLPGRIAAPALIANEIHQEQIMAELKDINQRQLKPGNSGRPQEEPLHFMLIPDQNGYMQMAVRLQEVHIVTRDAMKAPPAKSVLNGDLTADKTMEVANELLNEKQRNGGGGTVSEDQSRYQVILHRPDSTDTPDWTGEVIGPPRLFPLKTVNVLAGGRSIIVFDKSNKKLWEASFTYPIGPGYQGFNEEDSPFGAGPCVEHGNVLYVFDQAVLSAFDLTTGNVRWRLPSVGVVGLFFDDQGMMYVNTTTGSPDDIKYARQIDVTKSTAAVLLKVDPQTGKTLWSVMPGGFIGYLSGKYIYTIQSYDPNPTDREVLNDSLEGLQKPPFVRIKRISPKDGHVMWEHYQDRAPVAFHFANNSIELVFKREVQVLTCMTF